MSEKEDVGRGLAREAHKLTEPQEPRPEQGQSHSRPAAGSQQEPPSAGQGILFLFCLSLACQ